MSFFDGINYTDPNQMGFLGMLASLAQSAMPSRLSYVTGRLDLNWLRDRLPAIAAFAPMAATILHAEQRTYFAEMVSEASTMIGAADSAAGAALADVAGILRGAHLFAPAAGVH